MNIIIKNREEWEKLWIQFTRNNSPQPKVPQIDFDKEIVIGVFLGTRRTGGYNIVIEQAIDESSNNYTLFVRYDIPKRGSIVTMAMTSPFHIIAIDRSLLENKNVTFVKRT